MMHDVQGMTYDSADTNIIIIIAHITHHTYTQYWFLLIRWLIVEFRIQTNPILPFYHILSQYLHTYIHTYTHTYIIHHTSCITHHKSCIIHDTSHFMHCTSYIIYHTSHIIHHTSHTSNIHTSYMLHHTSYIIHHTSYIIHHTYILEWHVKFLCTLQTFLHIQLQIIFTSLCFCH